MKREKEKNQRMGASKKWKKDNRGVGVVEIILILVIIFTIYKGCK